MSEIKKWLKPDYWEWAAKYLQKTHKKQGIRELGQRCRDYNSLIEKIELLKDTYEGSSIIKSMKNALNQKKHRDKNKINKNLSLILSQDSANKIKSIARDLKTKKEDAIEAIINDADRIRISYKKEIQRIKANETLKTFKLKKDAERNKLKFDIAIKLLKHYIERLTRNELANIKEPPSTNDFEKIEHKITQKIHDEITSCLKYIEASTISAEDIEKLDIYID